MDDKIYIVEHYTGGKLTKRTANGVDIPVSALESELPVFVQQTVLMTKEEFAQKYPEEKLPT